MVLMATGMNQLTWLKVASIAVVKSLVWRIKWWSPGLLFVFHRSIQTRGAFPDQSLMLWQIWCSQSLSVPCDPTHCYLLPSAIMSHFMATWLSVIHLGRRNQVQAHYHCFARRFVFEPLVMCIWLHKTGHGSVRGQFSSTAKGTLWLADTCLKSLSLQRG